jgi:myb proto-oncogene protein
LRYVIYPTDWFSLLTSQDDAILIKLLEKEGCRDISEDFASGKKWSGIAKDLATGRNGKQCRDRWKNHLRPGIKKGDWTRDEEDIIRDMHSTFGGR